MERNVILAALLSAVLLAVYSEVVLKPQTRPRVVQPTAPATLASQSEATQAIMKARHDWLPKTQEEPVRWLRGNLLSVKIGEHSGALRSVVLEGFADRETGKELEISHAAPIFAMADSADAAAWSVVSSSATDVVLGRSGAAGLERLRYALAEKPRVVGVTYERQAASEGVSSAPFVLAWTRADSTSGNQNQLELIALQDIKKHKKLRGPFKAAKDVPRGTLTLSLSERYFAASIKSEQPLLIRAIPSPESAIAAEISSPTTSGAIQAQLYFGPRDYFHLKRSGFQSALPIGILGQIGLILLVMLGWIGTITNNYGVAVIVFSIVVTCITAPFTLMSFRSMKRMQALKPKIDALMAKHKEDPKRANQEMFALYKEHKVNPLGGCLPMLLQMPIFFALIQAISHYVGLRGKAFLWVKDLSLPDRFAQLPFSVPFIGNELNILPLVMAGAMYFQTKISQQSMSTGETNPTAQMMSGPLMPVIFSVMLYHFPSALVLYWITNSAMSMVWYRLAK